jgi:hypothetical protein
MPRYSYSLQPGYSEQGYSEFKLSVECRAQAQPHCLCCEGPAGLARSAVSRRRANLYAGSQGRAYGHCPARGPGEGLLTGTRSWSGAGPWQRCHGAEPPTGRVGVMLPGRGK